MENVLNIHAGVQFDESVSHYEIHAHQPYASSSSYNNSDEIRIVIQHQDLCILPSKSTLHISGRLTKADGVTATAATSLVTNAICFLFDDIRYELNAIEIDHCKNVGLTSTMKGYVSLTLGQRNIIENAGWIDTTLANNDGYFDVTIPLSLILGFAEDYRKVIVNAKHELIMTRARSDINAIIQGQDVEQFKITLYKIEWMMPYIMAADRHKIRLLQSIEKDSFITMSFRAWDLYEYPLLPTTSKHVWTVKTSTQLEKPRYVLLSFQTSRKDKLKRYANRFDHCDITNVKLFLNSQYYPYGNLNLDIEHNQFALLYEMYANFQRIYYDKEPEPLLKKIDFKDAVPLIVIDCSKQNEFLKQASVDVRLEFESRNNFPAETAAYCLIIHDRIIQYKPISGEVKKLV
ncbi:uncharacterized protein LOC127289544 [Leptopilina boulardi]|uniref:uncharacterized protein LOC127289544 n=1 Tax=Leptopilina boulardi TaxID=63433 RepID=UPI0021F57C24|nr:uncharacterized protein LOC127289544 [Leptopilina boulardi]